MCKNEATVGFAHDPVCLSFLNIGNFWLCLFSFRLLLVYSYSDASGFVFQAEFF